MCSVQTLGVVLNTGRDPPLARVFHELPSRDRGEGCATGQPQGVGSETYIEQYVAGTDTRGRPVQTLGVVLNTGRDLPLIEKLRARSQYHGHVSSLELGRLFHNTFFFSVRYDTLEDFQS